MALSKHDREIWNKAQEAEKGHWAWLWQGSDSLQRQDLINGEVTKGEFIFQNMIEHFHVRPAVDWSGLKVLDVGCGPLSLIARNKLGKLRAGVDPLRYPSWVYEDYKAKDFTVYEQPFEELTTIKRFDVIIFYNALQHFADLSMVAKKCRELLTNRGAIYLSEYLEVPTNEAHIQYLEASTLDKLFKSHGFNVDSASENIRLPGYVERPDGSPIGLYIAKLSLAN
ncbi:MAG TPA: methyltransferase domain-containing protein [Patescibacteria group bacterium]|nr:methyltransferase domain-containing protein [Patescibacteria group bacterium]